MKLTKAQLELLATGGHPGHHPDDGKISHYGTNPATARKLVEAGLLTVRKRRVSHTVTEYFLTEEGRTIAEPVRQEGLRNYRKLVAERRRKQLRVV